MPRRPLAFSGYFCPPPTLDQCWTKITLKKIGGLRNNSHSSQSSGSELLKLSENAKVAAVVAPILPPSPLPLYLSPHSQPKFWFFNWKWCSVFVSGLGIPEILVILTRQDLIFSKDWIGSNFLKFRFTWKICPSSPQCIFHCSVSLCVFCCAS